MIHTGWTFPRPAGVRPTPRRPACLTPVSSGSCEPGVSSNRGFGRGRRPHPFQSLAERRVVVLRTLCLTGDLAPASARRAHDTSNRSLQSTNVTCARDTARCTRFGRAGPRRRIRRAPLASTRLHGGRGGACRRRPCRARRGASSSRPNGSGAAAKRHPRRRSVYPDGDRSIRPRVPAPHLSMMRDSRRERRSPRSNRCLRYRWSVQGDRRVCLPEGSRDPWPLDHFCHHDCAASTKSQCPSPLDPRRAFGVVTENRFCCGRLRNDHPRVTARRRRCLAPLRSDSLHAVRWAPSEDCRWETRSRNTSRRRAWRP